MKKIIYTWKILFFLSLIGLATLGTAMDLKTCSGTLENPYLYSVAKQNIKIASKLLPVDNSDPCLKFKKTEEIGKTWLDIRASYRHAFSFETARERGIEMQLQRDRANALCRCIEENETTKRSLLNLPHLNDEEYKKAIAELAVGSAYKFILEDVLHDKINSFMKNSKLTLPTYQSNQCWPIISKEMGSSDNCHPDISKILEDTHREIADNKSKNVKIDSSDIAIDKFISETAKNFDTIVKESEDAVWKTGQGNVQDIRLSFVNLVTQNPILRLGYYTADGNSNSLSFYSEFVKMIKKEKAPAENDKKNFLKNLLSKKIEMVLGEIDNSKCDNSAIKKRVRDICSEIVSFSKKVKDPKDGDYLISHSFSGISNSGEALLYCETQTNSKILDPEKRESSRYSFINDILRGGSDSYYNYSDKSYSPSFAKSNLDLTTAENSDSSEIATETPESSEVATNSNYNSDNKSEQYNRDSQNIATLPPTTNNLINGITTSDNNISALSPSTSTSTSTINRNESSTKKPAQTASFDPNQFSNPSTGPMDLSKLSKEELQELISAELAKKDGANAELIAKMQAQIDALKEENRILKNSTEARSLRNFPSGNYDPYTGEEYYNEYIPPKTSKAIKKFDSNENQNDTPASASLKNSQKSNFNKNSLPQNGPEVAVANMASQESLPVLQLTSADGINSTNNNLDIDLIIKKLMNVYGSANPTNLTEVKVELPNKEKIIFVSIPDENNSNKILSFKKKEINSPTRNPASITNEVSPSKDEEQKIFVEDLNGLLE